MSIIGLSNYKSKDAIEMLFILLSAFYKKILASNRCTFSMIEAHGQSSYSNSRWCKEFLLKCFFPAPIHVQLYMLLIFFQAN